MKKLFTIVAMMLLAVMGLSACTAKTIKANQNDKIPSTPSTAYVTIVYNLE